MRPNRNDQMDASTIIRERIELVADAQTRNELHKFYNLFLERLNSAKKNDR